MCGLTFIQDPIAEEGDLRMRSNGALARLHHRGPDGYGLFSGPGWAMGHKRLSIIDVAGSPQPMWDPDRRYCLAYNGEVYNYRELRLALEPEWKFITRGDTEVVLAGLVLHGPQFLDRMEGMWAIALWDTVAYQLFLARDRMGKKPLYFDVLGKGIACASELPALRSLVTRAWHEDEDGTADYLRYGYYLPGYTAYREVREVLPGHFLYWRASESGVEQKSYWKLHPGRFVGTKADAAERLRETITKAVHRRMVADVEVGAFLSGGVDSSLVCSIVRRHFGQALKSFTIGFEDRAFDERAYALTMANELGTEHHESVLSTWNEEELERLLIENVGQPFADASLLPTALVSQVTATQVKVALSGDGGDELFSGYQRYQAQTILRWYSRLPKSLQKLGEHIVRGLPEPTAHHSRSIVKKAHLFMDIAARAGTASSYVAPTMFSPSDLCQLVPDLSARGHQPPELPEETSLGEIRRMMVADATIYLPQDILTKVDRASMAYSLELRSPFLDRDVVELAFSIPLDWHRNKTSGKHMLRSAFNADLPDSIWRRRKQGFSVPVHDWFRGRLNASLLALSEQCHSPLSSINIRELLKEHVAQGRDHGIRLWAIYSYLVWKSSTT